MINSTGNFSYGWWMVLLMRMETAKGSEYWHSFDGPLAIISWFVFQKKRYLIARHEIRQKEGDE